MLHPWNPQAMGEGVGVGVGVETGAGGGGVETGAGETKASVSHNSVSSLIPPVAPQLFIAETSHL